MSSFRRRLYRELRYHLLVPVLWPLGAFPRGLARCVARLYAGLAFGLLWRLRERARRHVATAYPDADPRWRERMARASFAWVALAGVDLLRLGRPECGRLLDRIEVLGEEHWSAAIRSGGVLVVTGHLGSWELLGAALARRGSGSRPPRRTYLLHRTVQPRALDLRLRRLRSAGGCVPLPVEEGMRDAVRALRRGDLVGVLADRIPRGGGVECRFFGRPCWSGAGPARLARAGRAAILPAALWAHGRDRYRLRFFAPIAGTGQAGEDGVAREVSVTRQLTALMEEMVREAPDQAPWFEDRWKVRRAAPALAARARSDLGV